MIRALEPFAPAWCEEPVPRTAWTCWPRSSGRRAVPIAAGERLYTLADFYRLTALRAADVVQMDLAHCGGILASKKIAAMAAAQDMRIAPALLDRPGRAGGRPALRLSTPNFMIQEAFAEFDVPWRNSLVGGWNPIRNGEFILADEPGLGLDLDEEAIAAHPYVRNAFPSLWDGEWLTNFTQTDR